MSRIRFLVCVLSLKFFIIGFFSPIDINAQEKTLEETDLIHWAYAAAFGTGVYRVKDDLEVFVISVKPKWTQEIPWKTALGERPVLLEFRFSSTFGVHNYAFDEIVGDLLSIQFKQLSFTPGLAMEIPAHPNWTLRPFGHLGWGINTSGRKEASWIYWAGVRSRLAFKILGSDFALLNGLGSFGFSTEKGESDSLSEIMTGLEWNPCLGKFQGKGERVYLKTHIVNFWYVDNLKFIVSPKKGPVTLTYEWEIGISVGKESEFNIWFLKFDRIGLAYRFGPNTRGIRLYLRSIFKN